MIIEIPFKTPTVNHLYGHWRGRVILKAEAKRLREEIIQIIDDMPVEDLKNAKLSVVAEIHEDWYYKNGEVKRADISNREKFLIDSVFQGLELDDKMIWSHTMIKVQSNEEKTIIKINKI